MKKTLIIIIVVVFFASIVIVNFFGLKVKEFDGVKYVKSISVAEVKLLRDPPETVEPKTYPSSGDTLWFEFVFIPPEEGTEYTTDLENIMSNPNALLIVYEILPHDANERSVEFIYDKDTYKDSVYFDEMKNTFVFLEPNIDLEVTIKSRDGSLAEVKFYLSSLSNSN